MEKIRALKEKHKCASAEELQKSIRTRFPRKQDNLKFKEQHLSELNAKVHELRSEISTLEETLNTAERHRYVQSQEYIAVMDKLKELEADRNNLITEVHQLESQRNHLRNKNAHPSSKDEETLKTGQMKLNFYRQLTGIKWDYSAPEGTIKGYVTNGKDHIHTFNYRKKVHDSFTLEDELWKEVARGTKRLNLQESDCKENSAPN